MRQRDVIADLDETWPEEAALRRLLTAGFRRMFQGQGVPDSPLLALRLRDVLSACFLVRHLERQMHALRQTPAAADDGTKTRAETEAKTGAGTGAGAGIRKPAPTPKPRLEGENPLLRVELLLADAHGKASERWRKTMKELEEHCASTGRPMTGGLAEYMKPIIKKANAALAQAKLEEEEQENS